jgi:D-alanyl-D-alanine endopeptidase (penicillin-binding protein 7)
MDAVLNWVWQGCVVAAATFVMLRVLDRAHANVRYVVCWAALLLIVALPALPSFQSAVSVDASESAQRAAIVSLPDSWWASAMMMLSAWMIWASVCTVRFGAAMLALRRARVRGCTFPSQVESTLAHWSRVRAEGRRATLVLSDSVTTAAVLPWGAPMIAVAPSLVTTLGSAELDRVLIHEWAHVQRRDDVVSAVQIVIRIIAGWHPAVWWIDRRLQREREIACDEMTVAITGSPKSYAECLLKLASVKGAARAVQGAPALFTMSGLRARVTKIVSPHRVIAPIWSRGIAAAIVSVLCLTSAGVAGMELVAAAGFALPVVPTRMLTTNLERLAPPALPTPSLPEEIKRSPRRATVSTPSPHGATAQDPARPPSPPPTPASDAPIAPAAVNGVDSTPAAAEPHGDGTVAPATPAMVRNPGPALPAVTAEQPRSPWGAAADEGVALGRKSKDASVATAGFFARFARRVAGSF